MYGLKFREELPARVADELDGLVAAIRNVFYAEHQEDGSHLDASPELALVPVGGMQLWPLASPPDRWLLCNGQAVSRVTYNALFKAIGIQFGAGDGTLTFNLPDMTGRFARGNDGTVGSTGGAATHTHTGPAHTHSISSGGAHTHGATTSSDGSHSHSTGEHSHANNNGSPNLADGGGDDAVAVYPSTSDSIFNDSGTSSDGAHTHTVTTDSQGSHDHGGATGSNGTGNTGSASSLPPYVNINYIIFAGG